jgi:DNA-binding IclR family transcriptional regulator
LPLQRRIPKNGNKSAGQSRRELPARDKNFVALAEKLFGVLEAFSTHPQTPITLEEVTESVGLAKTTVHRLLYSMKKIGYVEQDEAGNYKLAAKFFELGRSALPYQRLALVARPMLENLRLRCGESVHLGVLENGLINYIAVIESQNPYRCAAVPGEFNYAHSTALGKCLLAHLPDTEIDKIVQEHGLPKLARNTITSGAQLLEQLRTVRDEGVATNIEENIDGVICVAAPIFHGDGLPIAALSVSGPAIRMELMLDAVKQEVKRVALALSLVHGHHPLAPEPPLSLSGNPVSIREPLFAGPEKR